MNADFSIALITFQIIAVVFYQRARIAYFPFVLCCVLCVVCFLYVCTYIERTATQQHRSRKTVQYEDLGLHISIEVSSILLPLACS
jgi:cell division protein FtsW (lipid II flippase)